MRKLMFVMVTAVVVSGCAPFLHPGSFNYPHRARLHAAPPPVPTGRWDNVMRLPRSATIDVLTRDGAAHVGAFAGATSESLRVLIYGEEKQVDRSEVVRVDLVDLPGSEVRAVARSAARGALLGAGAAVLFGGVVGGETWPPPGPLVRGSAAVGGITAGQAALVQRQGRLIYLSPNP